MTNEEAITEIKELLKIEIDKLPYHHDAEFNDDVYDSMAELDKILELNKIVSKAIEKQIPKKPIEVASPVLKWGLCPACRGELNKLANQPNRVFAFHRFCPDCGQALDWSDLCPDL